MYFLLRGVVDKFHFLKYGIAVILMFIGVKLAIMELYHIPAEYSLIVILSILVLTISASHIYSATRKEK